MARTARYISSTGIYHIMMRGINRMNIFRDNADKIKFMSITNGILKRRNSISGKTSGEYEIYAYALMGNHFHMLIKVISGQLGDFVKALASGYVMYFNNKYQRDGHLFKERFKSEPCESDEYFFTLLRYIHQNPLKDRFVSDLSKYKYTSWIEYIAPEDAPFNICCTDIVLSRISKKEFSDLVYDMMPDNTKCIDISNTTGKVLDCVLIRYLKENLGIKNKEEIKRMNGLERRAIVKQLLEFGAGVCQIERLLGVSKASISRTKNKLSENSETK